MQSVGQVLRWVGRALLLAAPFVLLSSFFFPAGVQFLNPVVCPEPLELDNARYSAPSQPDNERLELVCTSPDASQSAARGIFLVVGGLVAGGITCLFLAQRWSRPRARIPHGVPVT